MEAWLLILCMLFGHVPALTKAQATGMLRKLHSYCLYSYTTVSGLKGHLLVSSRSARAWHVKRDMSLRYQ